MSDPGRREKSGSIEVVAKLKKLFRKWQTPRQGHQCRDLQDNDLDVLRGPEAIMLRKKYVCTINFIICFSFLSALKIDKKAPYEKNTTIIVYLQA